MLKEKILQNLNAALKEKKELETSVLRMLSNQAQSLFLCWRQKGTGRARHRQLGGIRVIRNFLCAGSYNFRIENRGQIRQGGYNLKIWRKR